MRKNKLLSILVVFGLLTVLVAGFSSASAAMVTDPKETFIKSIKSIQNVESCHVNFDLSASFPQGNNIDISAKGESDIQGKPMLSKMTMNLSMKDGTKKFEQVITSYFEEAENQILFYSNENNHWIKRSLPKNSSDHQSEEYWNTIKNVILKNEDANVMVFEVTVNMNYIKENLRRTTVDVPNTKLMFNILDNLDDFTYLVTIDKKTAYISKIEMDFSDCISKIVSNIADLQSGTSEQKNRFKAMFSNMKMTGTMTFSKFNNVGKITVPEDVKNQAKVVNLIQEHKSYPPSGGICPQVIERSLVGYPDEARKKGLEGNVLLRLNISDTGKVIYAEILQSSGFDILDNAAIDGVTKWRFTPAQMNAKATTSNIIVPIKFQLKRLKDSSLGLLNSEEIINIQNKLNELGFDCGEPDGFIGPKTEQAIKDFQQSRGLEPDGIVGIETKKALGI
ncbi:Gram-negative bacterial tonB protein [Sporomusa ovata DSM 2662]|uniref:Ferric siderophore transport system, periplasmic binding protein TonB n=1 Tax=Sporomusa ovata TaxID=2378 RepID=A0A0U1L1H2_9FIRM|nr:TonB family protein [Sporomusa ovata]EQB24570.1 hypothetical protein SOV_7c00540 [Sporomusa ovata DSM 2662]CQR73512.1 Ferric siderophore transport system, periplasmic binding protein TonB [Sporomusa ovata]